MLAPGTLLAGRFAVDGPPLGAGASGVVYPAVDRATGRRVAAKVLHASVSMDRDALERLQAEAAIAGRLRHPHVVEVIGLWSDRSDGDPGADAPGRWLLVSECVDGVSLDVTAPVPPEAVVALGLELVDALEAAAGLGLVHGDVRPGNVLVGASGGARLFDFGVARLATEVVPLRPGETAPERLDGAGPTPASDVYGLGIVMYRALTGELPWKGDTPWAVLGAQHQPLGEIPGPRGLATLLRAVLHPDPIERPDLPAVRRALTRLRTRPDRSPRLRWPIPRIRPGSAWSVYGTDPMTGAPALIRTGLSRREAKTLLAHLRAEGWRVRGVRSAFGGRDVLWIGASAVLGGVVVPLVGALPAAWLAARWRARAIRPSIARALPAVVATLPARPRSGIGLLPLLAGICLLATAAGLAWWPPAALVPALLLVGLAAWSLHSRERTPEELARSGRVQSALAELRARLDPLLGAPVPALAEDALGLAGEVDALEAEWRAGRVDAERVLVRVEDLNARASARPFPTEFAPTAALDALRRVSDP